jgi:alpha-tubulin suppressor-like RCC1 family protein
LRHRRHAGAEAITDTTVRSADGHCFSVVAFGGSAVVMAACGADHTLVLTHDGALWACGWGERGELGLNDLADRHAFERKGAGKSSLAGSRLGMHNRIVVQQQEASCNRKLETAAVFVWWFNSTTR